MLNRQQQRDLATRSVIGDRIVGLVNRANIGLFKYTEGMLQQAARVAVNEEHSRVAELVAGGFDLEYVDGQHLHFTKLAGLHYPLNWGAPRI